MKRAAVAILALSMWPRAEADTVIESMKITAYWMPTESLTSGQHTGDASTVSNPPNISGTYHREFLYSGWGVAMEGTGLATNGKYVKYVSGGGGWNSNHTWLKKPSTAKFVEASAVIGKSGRTLVADYSIAVDPKVIPLGSYVWIDSQGHWYRADDTGGKIKGKHLDIYLGLSGPAPSASSSRVFVTTTPHAKFDPSPHGAPSPPAQPTIQSPTKGALVSTNPVKLDWSDVAGAAYYHFAVYQNGSLVTQGWPNVSHATVALGSGSFAWYVWAHNSAGWSAGASSSFTHATIPTPAKPKIVFPANGAQISPGSVTLDWSDVPGIDYYQVSLYKGEALVDQQWPSSSSSSFSLTSGSYVGYVWAHNGGGWSAAESVAFTVSGSGVLGMPVGLSPDAWAAKSGATVQLNWSDVPGATAYDVSVVRWSGTSWIAAGSFTSFGSSYAYSPLQSQAYYAWRARASAGTVKGPWSEWASFEWKP